ncbi:PmoA family protein [Thalassobellus suaedae]|uniref:PmoA family protein n=1 Tax=Thalassobellus suaedae TaxID=3074124 RepID=A0ABY9XYS2_9FLAO|nr:PmoA family protein [Flavobacteriaceae bacterium HL-DH10]
MSSCKQSKKKDNIQKSNFVSLVKNDSLNTLDVFIDRKYFTSYMYADSILRKPVLFPIFTASEKRITRGFPINPNPGERMDHPHHYGLWFNHGVVNDIDFWNSAVIPKDPEMRYGRINHVKFLKVESGEVGTLKIEKEWRSDIEELLIKEQTRYVFSGDENKRIITLTTMLTAPEVDVLFTDSKEGMFAMRMRRELEIASDEPAILFENNQVTSKSDVLKNEGVSGHYRNSNGIEGYPEVWGKRAKWMQLAGLVDGDSISVCIFDSPKNLNHPPHWMTRDYGLYGVNPFGSNVYTNGEEQFNYTLKKGESTTFKYQVVIVDGVYPKPEKIETLYSNFIAEGI